MWTSLSLVLLRNYLSTTCTNIEKVLPTQRWYLVCNVQSLLYLKFALIIFIIFDHENIAILNCSAEISCNVFYDSLPFSVFCKKKKPTVYFLVRLYFLLEGIIMLMILALVLLYHRLAEPRDKYLGRRITKYNRIELDYYCRTVTEWMNSFFFMLFVISQVCNSL